MTDSRLTGADPVTRDVVTRVAAVIAGQGVQAYLVGGYVRDLLMGRPTRDLDIAAGTHNIERLGRAIADAVGGAFYVLNRERRFVRVLVGGNDDRNAVRIDLTPLDGDITSDLARRDFTINAMALPINQPENPGAVIDPHGGRSDIAGATVRAVREDVFERDPARLLRAVRVSAELGFTLDDDTATLVRRGANRIGAVSPERVRGELTHILSLSRSYPAIRQMDELGLLTGALPELDECRGVAQPGEHYWDVFNHQIETVGYFERVLDTDARATDPALSQLPWNAGIDAYFATDTGNGLSRGTLTKLACLFHDVAKPRTKAVESSGRVRFLGHPEQGAQIVTSGMERLHMSRREIAFVAMAVEQHLRPMQLSHELAPPTERALYRFRRDVGDVTIATLYLSMADYLAAKGPVLDVNEWQRRVAHCSLVLQGACETAAQGASTTTLIDGRVVMRALNIPPGPAVGRLLDAVREAIAVGEVTTERQAIALAQELWRQDQARGTGPDSGGTDRQQEDT